MILKSKRKKKKKNEFINLKNNRSHIELWRIRKESFSKKTTRKDFQG